MSAFCSSARVAVVLYQRQPPIVKARVMAMASAEMRGKSLVRMPPRTFIAVTPQ